MTDPNKITQCIEQILRKEQQAEEELKFTKELIYKLDCMNKSKSEYEKKICEMKTEFEYLEKENDNGRCDLELLKIELESLEKSLKDAYEAHKGVLKQMDELQQKKWNNQRRFCDSVGEFIDSNGTRATMKRNFNKHIRGQMVAALSGTDAENICKDNIDSKKTLKREAKFQELQSEISKNKTLIHELKTKLFHVQALNGSLQKEYEYGSEYKRLRNALKFSRDEASKYYAEMELINSKMDNSIMNAIPEGNNQLVTKQRKIPDLIKASDRHDVNNIMGLQGVEYSENELNSMYSEEIQSNDMVKTPNNLSYGIVEILTPGKNEKQFQRDCYICENNDGNDTNDAKKKKIDDTKDTRKKLSPREDVYKQINLMKEKVKASRKRQIKKFNLITPKK